MRKHRFGATPKSSGSKLDIMSIVFIVVLVGLVGFMIYNQVSGEFVFGYDSSEPSEESDPTEESEPSEPLE